MAGYSTRMEGEEWDPVLQKQYDWDKIKSHCKDFVFFNSPGDPWGCDDKKGRIMFDQVGGTLIIRNDGHYGSRSFNQPYETFELLDRLIA